MQWKLVQRVSTPAVAFADLYGAPWIFRGFGNLYAWFPGSTQIAWNFEFENESVGQEMLAAAGDLVIAASFSRDPFRTTFYGIERSSGKLRWKNSCEFRPSNRMGGRSISCDGQTITCVGSNIDDRFSILVLNFTTGKMQDSRICDSFYDFTISIDGNTFVGARDGLFILDRGRPELVLHGETGSLRLARHGLFALMYRDGCKTVHWLDSSGVRLGQLTLGVERSWPTLVPGSSDGCLIVMVRQKPEISLCDVRAGKTVWTVNNGRGELGVCLQGILLTLIDKGSGDYYLVAYDEDNGHQTVSPTGEHMFAAQIYGHNDLFALSLVGETKFYVRDSSKNKHS